MKTSELATNARNLVANLIRELIKYNGTKPPPVVALAMFFDPRKKVLLKKRFKDLYDGMIKYSRINLTTMYMKECQDKCQDDPLQEEDEQQQPPPAEKSNDEDEPPQFDPSNMEESEDEDEEGRDPKRAKVQPWLSGKEKAEAMADADLKRWDEADTRKERATSGLDILDYWNKKFNSDEDKYA